MFRQVIGMTKKNLILKISGWILIALGTTLNILMFVSAAYPTYLFFILMGIGILFLVLGAFIKKINVIMQIVVCLTPFIIMFLIFKINEPSQDTFLIPSNFRGTVYVYYDYPKGQPEEFEGSRRIYRIPTDGILFSQFKLKGNSISLSDAKYYLLDESGNRKELQHCSVHDQNIDTTTVQAIYGELGNSGEFGTYQTFYIDKPTKIFFKTEKRIRDYEIEDSIIRAKMKSLK